RFGDSARPVVDQLIASDRPAVRVAGIAALARLDVNAAAARFAQFITEPSDAELGPALAAILDAKGGVEKLLVALKQTKPTPDGAKLALRALRRLGRNHPRVADLLADAAGVKRPTPPTAAEVKSLLELVVKHGDAARG